MFPASGLEHTRHASGTTRPLVPARRSGRGVSQAAGSWTAHPWIRPPETASRPSGFRRTSRVLQLLRRAANDLHESAIARAIRSWQHPQPICTTHHSMDGTFRSRALSPLALPRLAHGVLFPPVGCVPRRDGEAGGVPLQSPATPSATRSVVGGAHPRQWTVPPWRGERYATDLAPRNLLQGEVLSRGFGLGARGTRLGVSAPKVIA
jgi:hypothetical protein